MEHIKDLNPKEDINHPHIQHMELIKDLNSKEDIKHPHMQHMEHMEIDLHINNNKKYQYQIQDVNPSYQYILNPNSYLQTNFD
jgi:hypothetical protein